MNWKLLISLLIIFDIILWSWIAWPQSEKDLTMYFLDVGQGDSELINLDKIHILVDGGPDAKVLEQLSKVLSANDRYLDLVILTHPHLDHFGGLIDVLKNYKVGLLLDSGFSHEDLPQYQYFQKEMADYHTRRLVLREGDKIKYKDLELDVISPPVNAQPTKVKDIHDNTIVFLLKKDNLRALYTGDINFRVEDRLLRDYKNLSAQLLKVSHHGSNKSSETEFLTVVHPQIAVIEVGQHNRYGHPKAALLERLRMVGAKIYRTDQDGTIKISLLNDKLNVATQK